MAWNKRIMGFNKMGFSSFFFSLWTREIVPKWASMFIFFFETKQDWASCWA
jgi:hypothetical protein